MCTVMYSNKTLATSPLLVGAPSSTESTCLSHQKIPLLPRSLCHHQEGTHTLDLPLCRSPSFPPPYVVGTHVMATSILSVLTLGILVWYIDPPTPPLPLGPSPHLVFTIVQPSSVSPSTTLGPTQEPIVHTKPSKGGNVGGKAKILGVLVLLDIHGHSDHHPHLGCTSLFSLQRHRPHHSALFSQNFGTGFTHP
jgi:hypothetical protein